MSAFLCSAQEPLTGIDRAISDEVMRQRRIAGGLHESIDVMKSLLLDLRSNALQGDPGSMKLTSLHHLLNELADENVARSGELLRRARSQPEQRPGAIMAAQREVDVVVQRLREIIDEAGMERRKRIYNALLQEIIEDQWATLKETILWGRAMLAAPATARVDAERLRQSQQLVRNKLGSFTSEVRAGIDADDGSSMTGLLEDVIAALQVRRVSVHQRNAAEAIIDLDPADATEEEQAALRGLQDVVDILNGVDWNELQQLVLEAELKEKIREIVNRQKTLRLDVIRLPDRAQTQDFGEFVPPQEKLRARLIELEPEVEKLPSKAVLGPAVTRAAEFMDAAARALQEARRKPATDAQLRAITILEDALDAFEIDNMTGIAQRPIPLGLGNFGMLFESSDGFNVPPGAGFGMGPGIGIGLAMGGGGGMSIAGGGGWGPPGGPPSGEAGMGAGEAGMGAGEAGPGEAGMGIGSGGGPGEGMGMDDSGVPDMNPGGGTGHRWGSDDVAEDASLRGAASVGHLGAVARQQIEQLYERELPPMYRGMIRDYFEVLAAEER